ncbi:MAG: GNAT family N-acetyltransferase [Bdellovibrionales bacterium]|nr:GNAT family N-acetyltransferase [Bdellovibrionales bacterium]
MNTKAAGITVEFEEIKKEELAAAGALLDSCFPVRPGGHFFDDFPVWGPAGNEMMRLFGARAPGSASFIACAGARIAELRIRGAAAPLQVGVIGAVATHPDHRGRGLASAAVASALQWLDIERVGVTLLWGSEHELYRRMGFELCGEQRRAELVRLVDPKDQAKDLKIHEGWSDRLWPWVSRREVGLLLRDADQEWFSAHRGTRWFRAEKSGEVLGYAALGRGIDLPGIVHEWGGAPEVVRALLAYVLASNPEAQLLYPAGALGPLGLPEPEESIREYLCMARITRPTEVAQALGGPASRLTFTRSGAGQTWIIGWGDQTLGEVEPTGLSRLLFGPIDGLAEAELPAKLWVWGLDAG